MPFLRLYIISLNRKNKKEIQKNVIEMMRAFIAIDVEMNDKIEEIYNLLKKTKAKLKMVEPQNIHLTIKFLGEIDEKTAEKVKEELHEAVREIEPFKAMLKGTGVFPGKNHIRVIWIGFHDEGETLKLSQVIDEKLTKYGFKKEKSYKPHVTIARMKSREGKEEILKIVEENKDKIFGEMECNEIKLKQSILTPKGPIYKDVEVVKL